jgi:hypothetical protein
MPLLTISQHNRLHDSWHRVHRPFLIIAMMESSSGWLEFLCLLLQVLTTGLLGLEPGTRRHVRYGSSIRTRFSMRSRGVKTTAQIATGAVLHEIRNLSAKRSTCARSRGRIFL